eukprot:5390483-Amphidinium_carterae.1
MTGMGSVMKLKNLRRSSCVMSQHALLGPEESGDDHNNSWNCGHEGNTGDAGVNRHPALTWAIDLSP